MSNQQLECDGASFPVRHVGIQVPKKYEILCTLF